MLVNNLNGPAAVLRNESSAPRVAVRLKGRPPNTRGIGARIQLSGGAVPMQSQEMICGGRYQSSDEAMRFFAAGSLTNLMTLEVTCRTGARSVVANIQANRIYEIDEGLAALERAVALSPGESLWLAQLGEAYGLAGKAARAREILRDLETQASRQYVAPNHLAYVYTGLGEHDRAMDYLEQAFEQQAGTVYGIRSSFLFAPLRAHPRFQALLRRMRLA